MPVDDTLVAPVIHRTTLVTGETVLWSPYPGRLRARLMFRVGVQDERLATRGITHLVEHLALTSTDQAMEHNGCTEGRFTSFDLAGAPDSVVGQLAQVSSRLAALPADRFDHERRVLRLESGRHGSWLDELRQRRYGLRGPGLTACAELGLHQLSIDDAQAWAQERFVSSNAVLWLSGPPPAGLALHLPTGHRTDEPPLGLLVQQPGWFLEPDRPLALSLLSRTGADGRAAMWWLHRQLQEHLRSTTGLVYGVVPSMDTVAPEVVELAMGMDRGQDNHPALLDEMMDLLGQLRTGDIPEADLVLWRQGLMFDLQEPQAVLGLLDGAARSVLCELSSTDVEDRMRDVRAVTPDSARLALTEALGTVLVQTAHPVPDRYLLPPLPDRAPQTVAPSTVFVGSREQSGGHRLLLGLDGVSLELADGTDPLTVLWSECEALVRDSAGCLSVAASDGHVLFLDPRHWERGEELYGRMTGLLPRTKLVEMSSEQPGEATSVAQVRPLAGLAAMSTVPLVILTGGITLMALMSVGLLLPDAEIENRSFAAVFVAVLAAGSLLSIRGLWTRLRSPKAARGSLDQRARTSVAVQADRTLARASLTSVIALSVGSWALVLLLLIMMGPSSFWPCIAVSAFGWRASREWSARTRRTMIPGQPRRS